MAWPRTTYEGLKAKLVPDGDCSIWLGAGVGTNKEYGLTKIEGRQVRVHVAIYEYENGPVPKGLKICHKCGRGRCGNGDHLYAGTSKQNAEDRERHGNTARGEKSGVAKLTDEKVRKIRAMYIPGKTRQVDIAKEVGVTQATVSKVLLGTLWAHVDVEG